MILNEQNYYGAEANTAYMSVSQLKSFLNCEANAIAEVKGLSRRAETTALLVGGYVDAFFSGTIDLFKAQHPEICKKDGTLKSEYVQADAIIRRLERDPLMSAMLSGDSQAIKTGEIEGVPFKVKMDSLLSAQQCAEISATYPEMADTLMLADGAIVDLKIMKDFRPIYKPGQGRLSFVEAWRYDLQLAIYQAIDGRKLPCFITAATKEDEPDITLIHIPQYMLDAALISVLQAIPYYDALKKGLGDPVRCGICDWCKRTKVMTGAVSADEFGEDAADE